MQLLHDLYPDAGIALTGRTSGISISPPSVHSCAEAELRCRECVFMEFETVVVGAGPGGLFAALHAAKSGRVLLVDSGSSLTGRLAVRSNIDADQANITSGFGGAGLFSDGKLCLSHRIGSTVSHRFPSADVDRRQRWIDAVIRDGHDAPLRGIDSQAAERLVKDARRAGLDYLHYPVRHVGTDQLPEMLTGFLSRLGPRVEVRCRTTCRAVLSGTGRARWRLELDGQGMGCVEATNVVLAPGKVGASWLSEVGDHLELPREPARPKLGFRLEGHRDFLAPLLSVAHDPKVIWRGEEGAEARTHCVCLGGDVVAGAYDDLVLVGGHSRSDHAANRSNCALIAAPTTWSSLSEAETRRIVRRINAAHNGGVVAQRLGEFLGDDPTHEGRGFDPSLPTATHGDLRQFLPLEIVHILARFVRSLSELCPDAAQPHNLIYGPAAERWAHRFVVTDEMEAAPGLFLVGDGPGLTGGIIAAAETGLLAGEAIASRTEMPLRPQPTRQLLPEKAPGSEPLEPMHTDGRSALTDATAPIWTAESLDVDQQVHWLNLAEVSEILTALDIARARYRGQDLSTYRGVSRVGFPLRSFGECLRWMAEEAATGSGFAVLRGLPVDDLDDSDCGLLIRGLATYLGDVATQSRDGQLIRHVRATGRALGDAAVRGHETAERLYFHTDGADAAVLLCRREASSGGRSRLASAASVHNRLLEINPAMVDLLYRPFHFHMAGGHVPGLRPTFSSPIFSVHRGLFSARYVRHTLLETTQVTGIPLTLHALEAFDALEEIAGENCVEMDLRAGDLQIVNNHTVFHSRTAYTDDTDRPRHLLRTWLTFPGYEGRRPGLVDEGLRFGWLTDELQHRIVARTTSPSDSREKTSNGA
jgi:uncharacterized protein